MKARTLGVVAAAGLAALVGGCKSERESTQAQPEVEATIAPGGIDATIYEDGGYRGIMWQSDYGTPKLAASESTNGKGLVFFAMDITNLSVNKICMNGNCVSLTPETFQYAPLFQKASERVKEICNQVDCAGLYERWQNKQYTIWDEIQESL